MYTNGITKKTLYFLLIITIVTLSISGCETIGAFKAKDIKMDDVSHLLKLGLLPSESEEESIMNTLNKINTWMEKNLW